MKKLITKKNVGIILSILLLILMVVFPLIAYDFYLHRRACYVGEFAVLVILLVIDFIEDKFIYDL